MEDNINNNNVQYKENNNDYDSRSLKYRLEQIKCKAWQLQATGSFQWSQIVSRKSSGLPQWLSQQLTMTPTLRSSLAETREAFPEAYQNDFAPSHTGKKQEWMEPNTLLPNIRGNPREFYPAAVSFQQKSHITFKCRDISEVIPSPGSVRLRMIPNLNSFEADDHVFILMGISNAQVHVILEKPLLLAHWIPGLICDTWNMAIHTTGQKNVSLKIYGAVDYLHSDCHPSRVVGPMTLSTSLGGQVNILDIQDKKNFGFAKFNEMLPKWKVNKWFENDIYIFGTNDQIKASETVLKVKLEKDKKQLTEEFKGLIILSYSEILIEFHNGF
ncbi:hypothetical protein BDD12DRAFT_877282 [Trichophaea hybrida]|nr:hypothetical protein BDD12DRAFT_877282 [Trichophaea hybrida]